MGAHRVSISTSRRGRGLFNKRARGKERAGTVGNNSIQFNSIQSSIQCAA